MRQQTAVPGVHYSTTTSRLCSLPLPPQHASVCVAAAQQLLHNPYGDCYCPLLLSPADDSDEGDRAERGRGRGSGRGRGRGREATATTATTAIGGPTPAASLPFCSMEGEGGSVCGSPYLLASSLLTPPTPLPGSDLERALQAPSVMCVSPLDLPATLRNWRFFDCRRVA